MSENPRLTVTLHQEQDFQFRVHFDGTAIADLLTDESEPLGQGLGPSPSLMLTTAIANCLSASLLFALRKFKNQPGPLVTTATTELVRNEQGRLRVGHVQVDIQLAEAAAAHASLERILAQFENFCTVTESVRHGVDVAVSIRDAEGVQLHGIARLGAASNADG
ncbi:MAG TPA: OsmC family protein [Pseudoxanthomonas sp.]|nr:OsmC family protein [Pseudoxanthomonas sp.]